MFSSAAKWTRSATPEPALHRRPGRFPLFSKHVWKIAEAAARRRVECMVALLALFACKTIRFGVGVANALNAKGGKMVDCPPPKNGSQQQPSRGAHLADSLLSGSYVSISLSRSTPSLLTWGSKAPRVLYL